MPSYIEDGYQQRGHIKPLIDSTTGGTVHDGLTFEYRCATRSEVIRLDAELRTIEMNVSQDPDCAVKSEERAARFVSEHTLEWDLKNQKGDLMPVNPLICMRIQYQLFNRLYRIIRGTELPDPISGSKEKQTSLEDQQKN